ncbi:hypothetical protein [Limosilactobacillus antri]|uniref:hypothetical protein n=1 Tax=Limosilactobacillus antri TaxID=227943 RepID=UPI00058F097A|nr:hypothetical protein [Limosilactobacillus antri]
MKIDAELEFILRHMSLKNFISIMRKSGGYFGDAKKINNKYRKYLIDSRIIKQTVPRKVYNCILSEVRVISNETLETKYVNTKENLFQLICKKYLSKENLTEIISEYSKLNNETYTRNIVNHEGKENYQKKLKKLKEKVGIANEAKQTKEKLLRIAEKERKRLVIENTQIRSELSKNKEEIDSLKKLLAVHKEKEQIESGNEVISNLKSENGILKRKLSWTKEALINKTGECKRNLKEMQKLQDKITMLETKHYLIVGVPVDFNFIALKIPKNIELDIFSKQSSNENIKSYGTFTELKANLSYQISEYVKVIAFNCEIPRGDLMRLEKLFGTSRLLLIDNVDNLENILN